MISLQFQQFRQFRVSGIPLGGVVVVVDGEIMMRVHDSSEEVALERS